MKKRLEGDRWKPLAMMQSGSDGLSYQRGHRGQGEMGEISRDTQAGGFTALDRKGRSLE